MSDKRFGFTVREAKPDEWEKGHPGGWDVFLPHQCDSWSITSSDSWGPPVPHEEAVASLRAFIEEAQEALVKLKERGRACDWETGFKDGYRRALVDVELGVEKWDHP